MAYIFTNPNPKNQKVGDCVIRALSIALNRSWREVYTELSLYGFSMSDMPSSNSVWDAMLSDHGFDRHVVSGQCADGCYTVRHFCEDHPHGVYVLGIGNHVVTAINGDYYDTWDSGDESPIYFYKERK